MRTTINLDDDLLAEVEALSGIRDRSSLLREALLEMRHRLTSQRLALLAGTEPGVVAPPRRRAANLLAEPKATPYLAKKRAKAKA
jgi:predicted transcriptional regulator